jgi:sphinganine-1-phosphate aldolase
LLSFLQKEGLFDRKWDFSVPGVTTVSVDLHKYGFASKGASCVAFRDPKLRALTYVPSADGCEGLYVTPTLQGSRSGATMAAAWATLVHMGEEGYRAAARKMHEATLTLKKELGSVKGLKLAGDPSLAIVPLCGTDGLDVYCLASLLEKKGWGVFTGQKPATVAIPVGERTPHLLPSLIADVKESVTYLLAHPETKPEGTAAVYGAAASIPDNVLESVLRGYIDVKMTVKPKKGGAGAA